jgi:hypothetical protein
MKQADLRDMFKKTSNSVRILMASPDPLFYPISIFSYEGTRNHKEPDNLQPEDK